jgi:hypothetical protein
VHVVTPDVHRQQLETQRQSLIDRLAYQQSMKDALPTGGMDSEEGLNGQMELEERELQIHRIEREIQDVNEMFKDLSSLVDTQSEAVHNINYSYSLHLTTFCMLVK